MSLPAGQEAFSLEDLRLLAALAETGSLAAAARHVRVNHASAWRRLGALEGRLGVRLFDRHRTGYAATPAGEEAVAVARRMLAELDVLERRLAGQDIRPTGVVRLTTTDTLLALVLPVVAGLRMTHPGLVVELVADNNFFTLTRRDADIALRPAGAAPDGLVARRLGAVATAVYVAARYREIHRGDPLTLDWLAPDDSLSHLGSARWITDRVAPERIVHRANSLLALAAAARAGIGLAPLPCVIADPDPDLVRVMPPLPEMATSLWLLTHPDLRRTARVRAVLDALADYLKTRRALLAGGEARSTA